MGKGVPGGSPMGVCVCQGSVPQRDQGRWVDLHPAGLECPTLAATAHVFLRSLSATWVTLALSGHGLFFGGIAADLDGDYDPDLFVSAGANDGPAEDLLYENTGDPLTPLSLTDLELIPRTDFGQDQRNASQAWMSLT